MKLFVLILLVPVSAAAQAQIASKGLILDLDADTRSERRGVSSSMLGVDQSRR
jgi:hypothetical protein